MEKNRKYLIICTCAVEMNSGACTMHFWWPKKLKTVARRQ